MEEQTRGSAREETTGPDGLIRANACTPSLLLVEMGFFHESRGSILGTHTQEDEVQ